MSEYSDSSESTADNPDTSEFESESKGNETATESEVESSFDSELDSQTCDTEDYDSTEEENDDTGDEDDNIEDNDSIEEDESKEDDDLNENDSDENSEDDGQIEDNDDIEENDVTKNDSNENKTAGKIEKSDDKDYSETDEEKEEISNKEKDHTYDRPSGYRKGVRDQVWEQAEKDSPDGIVRDPVTGEKMSKDDPWDMGHKPGYEFTKHQESAQRRGLTRKEFLDEHNNPEHYRPELPSSNRSHKGESKTENYYD